MNEAVTKKRALEELFRSWAGESPTEINVFPSSGSNRKYFRLSGSTGTAIGVIGEDARENRAFLAFSRQFRKLGLHVPQIHASDEEKGIYLQEDLGDTSLFSLVTTRQGEGMNASLRTLYQSTLKELIRFQLEGADAIDFSLCFPVSTFTRQAMLWDLNYFKYYYLRPSGIAYDEQALEQDFQHLADYLGGTESDFFMYRDFQGRNIFIRNGTPWFIDYQGGRRGPLQYDLASLLFQARASLPMEFREEMVGFYMDELATKKSFDRDEFLDLYYGFILLRTLQVLGAYGYRGFFEQKPHFIESAAYALDNARWLLENIELPLPLTALKDNLWKLLERQTKAEPHDVLTVDVGSFSYLKYGYPKDPSGHGGGFVFDCRALPNPGRYPEYRPITGKDRPVIEFLEKEQAVTDFLDHVYRIVGQAVDNYLVRGFDHLSVNFGCTGGQHRSVYCAEQLYRFLRQNYRIRVNLSHKMLD